MSESALPSSDTEGKLVKRFVYPDGRLTALVTVGNDWQIIVFASELAATAFARYYNLTIEEIADGNSGG